jgi:hypothetical protein
MLDFVLVCLEEGLAEKYLEIVLRFSVYLPEQLGV